jgi:hypothetical protein
VTNSSNNRILPKFKKTKKIKVNEHGSDKKSKSPKNKTKVDS